METVQSTESTTVHGFEPIDIEYLVKRGVDPELAWGEGLRSMTEAEVHHWTGNVTVVGGGLCQPYRLPLPPTWANANKCYVRIQLHERDQNGGRKTDVPSGPNPPLYFTSTAAKPSTDPIFVSECPIKALSIASAGYPCSVGLGGVSAGLFESGTKMTVLQPHLEPYFQPGRLVYLVLDSNRLHKLDVARAEAKIARALLDRQCVVKIVEIPKADDGKDQGPDDFLANKGKAAFDELVATRGTPIRSCTRAT